MQIGHAGKNRGSNDTGEPRRPGRPVRVSEDQRAVRRRRLLQSPRHRLRRGRPARYKRHWGAYGKRPDDGYKFPPRAQLVQGDAAAAVQQPGARGGRVERRARLRRRPHQQPAAGVPARRHVRQGNVHRQDHAAGGRARSTASRCRRTRIRSSSTCWTDRTRPCGCWTGRRSRSSRTSAATPATTRGNSSTRTASSPIRRATCSSAR